MKSRTVRKSTIGKEEQDRGEENEREERRA
jgi:hypothetical protein